MGLQNAFDYNALRDDHPDTRKRKFFYFLIDICLLAVGAYFIFRYATGWGERSSLFYWWFLPGLLCLLLAAWSVIGFLRKTRATDRHLERYVRIDESTIYWWLDKNESPQNLSLDTVKNIEYTTRDIIVHTTAGEQHTLHTYLILAPQKESELRRVLQSRFGQ